MSFDSSVPHTRRAILIAAIGGTVGTVLAAVGHATPVEAADGNVVHVGSTHYESSSTAFVNRENSHDVLEVVSHNDASSAHGTAIHARSDAGFAIAADSVSGTG